MANPYQKTILIYNVFEEIKQICTCLQKDTGSSNLEIKIFLKLIINDWGEKKKKKLVLGEFDYSHGIQRHHISKIKIIFPFNNLIFL